jgi:hypothetical protein
MLPPDGGVDAAVKIVHRNRIAAPQPCYNEQAVIGKVIANFGVALPEIAIGIDHNSSAARAVEVAARAAARAIDQIPPAGLSIGCGLVLGAMIRGRHEPKCPAYPARRSPVAVCRRS